MQSPSIQHPPPTDAGEPGKIGMLRVLIVDDHPEEVEATVCALREHLGDRLRHMVVKSPDEGMAALRDQQFDIAVVELGNSYEEAASTLACIDAAARALPIVVYTRLRDDALGLRALRTGAQDFLIKSEVPTRLLPRALHAAIERQSRLAAVEQERREAAHRASHDHLTGLANRALFLDQLERTLAFGARYGRKTGLLFVDLDNFKGINDTWGHAAGDTVLRHVAQRLTECVRKSDSVARLGGDEFAVMLQDVTSRRDMAHVRRLIDECLSAPIQLGENMVPGVSVSIGTAMSPLDGSSPGDLLASADARMYRAKAGPRQCYAPAAASSGIAADLSGDSAVIGRERTGAMRREQRLRHALLHGQFEVHYQPVVDTVARKLVGAEALLRWRDPDRGLIGPTGFLPLAEDTGLIVPIGDFVLREACRAVISWRDLLRGGRGTRMANATGGVPGVAHPQYHDPSELIRPIPGVADAFPELSATELRVSVNLSAVQLRERDFETRVQQILDETGCPPEALTFELTESSALVDGDLTLESLRAIKQLGIQLAIDDFGVGYASMTFLREAPIDGIKIDRRFVANLLHDRRDAAIVSSLIRLARGLSLGVTGEGIETVEQSHYLARLQCFEQQGHLFSDVIAGEAFTAMLESLIAGEETGTAFGRRFLFG